MFSPYTVQQAAFNSDLIDAQKSIEQILVSINSSDEEYTIDDVFNVMYILDLVEVHGIGKGRP